MKMILEESGKLKETKLNFYVNLFV